MDEERPSPAPVWLCAGFLSAGGLICLGLAAWLVLAGAGLVRVIKRGPEPGDLWWLWAGWRGAFGLLQLVLAAGGIWRGQPADDEG